MVSDISTLLCQYRTLSCIVFVVKTVTFGILKGAEGKHLLEPPRQIFHTHVKYCLKLWLYILSLALGLWWEDRLEDQ